MLQKAQYIKANANPFFAEKMPHNLSVWLLISIFNYTTASAVCQYFAKITGQFVAANAKKFAAFC